MFFLNSLEQSTYSFVAYIFGHYVIRVLIFFSFICNNYDPVLGLNHQLLRDKVLRTQDNIQSIPMIKRLGNWGLEKDYLVMDHRLVLRIFGVQSCSLTIKSIQERPGWVFSKWFMFLINVMGIRRKGDITSWAKKKHFLFFFLILSFCSEHSCYLLSR